MLQLIKQALEQMINPLIARWSEKKKDPRIQIVGRVADGCDKTLLWYSFLYLLTPALTLSTPNDKTHAGIGNKTEEICRQPLLSGLMQTNRHLNP
jgi:hypothetical protein